MCIVAFEVEVVALLPHAPLLDGIGTASALALYAYVCTL